eukprot:296466_1
MQPTASNHISNNTNTTIPSTNNNNNTNNNKSNTNHFDIGKVALSYPEIDGLVYSYLKARGYQSAVHALVSESHINLNLTEDQILASNALHIITDKHKTMLHSIYGYTHSDHNIEWFDDSYRYLSLWVNQCLDCYRIELLPITYPIFIHFIFELLLKSQVEKAQNFYYKYNKEHTTLHAQDLATIYDLIETIDINNNNKNKQNNASNTNNPTNASDNNNHKSSVSSSKARIQSYPIYNRYRKHKYQLSISIVSHNLFMSWLNSSKLNLLIKTVNDHIDFHIVSHEPSMKENIVKPPLGIDNHQLIEMNKNKMSWGISRYMDQMETKALKERESIKTYNIHKPKGRLMRTEFAEIHASQPKYSKDDEKLIHNEIKNRVYSGPDRLPSICSYKFINARNDISCTNVSTNGKWIVGGCNDSTIKLFDVAAATGKAASIPNENEDALNNNSNTNTNNQSTNVNTSSSSHCHKLIGHKSSVTSISFYPDRDFFVSSSADNTVRLWSTEFGGQCLSWYRGHCFPIWDVQFSPLGLYFATASHDRTARLWSTDKGVPIRIFAGHVSDVECVRFHPNCNYLVSGSSDRTIRCWDIQSGDCVRLMTGHTNTINDLQFTSDGRCVVSASKDNTIRVWDIATSECISVLEGHTNDVTKIALAHTVNRNAVVIEQNTNNT